jgi:hypothetical protein
MVWIKLNDRGVLSYKDEIGHGCSVSSYHHVVPTPPGLWNKTHVLYRSNVDCSVRKGLFNTLLNDIEIENMAITFFRFLRRRIPSRFEHEADLKVRIGSQRSDRQCTQPLRI